MHTYTTYDTAISPIHIVENGAAITHVFRVGHKLPDGSIPKQTSLIEKTYQQLLEYFAGIRQQFTIPLEPNGTPFQKQVWEQLTQIPYGQTRTYGEIAKTIGNPKASRAVGMANHNNPIMILIPCHRVIGKNGDLTGYAGGIAIKEKLLELENGKIAF